MKNLEYLSERIVNISELEDILERCYILAHLITKESPDNEHSQMLKKLIRAAKDFEFRIEKRKIHLSN